jgi:uncharacterized protein
VSAADNKQTTRAAYDAFSRADLDAVLAVMDDDIEWTVPGRSAISGTYRGKEEVTGFFITLAGRTFTTEPQEFIAEDDHVVVIGTSTTDGQSWTEVDVLTFRDGKLAAFTGFGDTGLAERIWGPKTGVATG